MESHNKFEELDDRAYTESFDDVMSICPRPGMTAQERYEFRKNNRPSLANSNRNTLSTQDFDTLIVRLRGLEDKMEVIELEKKDLLKIIFTMRILAGLSILAGCGGYLTSNNSLGIPVVLSTLTGFGVFLINTSLVIRIKSTKPDSSYKEN